MKLYSHNNLNKDGLVSGTFASRVYGWMTLGLSVTAGITGLLSYTGFYKTLYPYWWLWCLGTLGVSLWISRKINTLSVQGVMGLFIAYSVLEGLFFGTVIPGYAATYGGGVVWAAFLSAAGIFAIAALYGTFTHSDMTGLGRIFSLGLFALIGLSIIYFIVSSFVVLPGFYLLICYLGLVMFVGLSAYDAQTIKRMSLQADINSSLSYKLALVMALRMYINVIMIFWYLLQIFASSSKNK
ncbi:MAG: Bax inhibitor-1/YccA family protein [Victivallaceae bacterium]